MFRNIPPQMVAEMAADMWAHLKTLLFLSHPVSPLIVLETVFSVLTHTIFTFNDAVCSNDGGPAMGQHVCDAG